MSQLVRAAAEITLKWFRHGDLAVDRKGDGTKAFTQVVPLYTNLLALEDGHGPLIGVVKLASAGRDGRCLAGHRARVVFFGVVTANPTGAWTTQTALNLILRHTTGSPMRFTTPSSTPTTESNATTAA